MKVPTPKVGDTVLLKIHNGPGNAPVFRPLLVVHVDLEMPFDEEVPVVTGELFLNYETDGSCTFVQRNGFYKPHRDARTQYCRRLYPGNQIGEWQPKDKLTPIPPLRSPFRSPK